MSCTGCPAGKEKESNAASAACVDCAYGKYADESGSTCTACATGKYADQRGSTSCKLCSEVHGNLHQFGYIVYRNNNHLNFQISKFMVVNCICLPTSIQKHNKTSTTSGKICLEVLSKTNKKPKIVSSSSVAVN